MPHLMHEAALQRCTRPACPCLVMQGARGRLPHACPGCVRRMQAAGAAKAAAEDHAARAARLGAAARRAAAQATQATDEARVRHCAVSVQGSLVARS